MQTEKRRWQVYLVFAGMMILGIVGKNQKVQQWLAVDATPIEAEREEKTEMPPQVALTFDDGPHPSYTKKLLDGLKERGVKATFFVVGENIPGREEIIKQMWEDGHLIGNHTWDHEDISKMSPQEACAEFQKTSNLVKKITGAGTAYVRAPFGNWDDALNCETTMISVRWSVDTLDWTTKNVQQIVNKVVNNVKENDIILLHDYYDSSVEAALQIVDILQSRGYELVTVEELLLE